MAAETKDQQTGTSGRLAAAAWDVLTHPVTFVVLTILWVIDLGAGSIAAYFNDPRFWVKMDSYTFADWMRRVAPATFPSSLWVYILVVLSYLMVLSLLLCTVNWLIRRRRKLRGVAEFLVHLGFLLVFTGFVLGSMLGSRAQLTLAEGGRSVIPGTGMELSLEDLQVVTAESGRPVDTVSALALFEGSRRVGAGTARTNHPYIPFFLGSTVIYPPDDYRVWVEGGVVEMAGGQKARVVTGRSTRLPSGGYLTIGGVLQSGQRRGSAMGPGFLLRQHGQGGRMIDSVFMSAAPGMGAGAELGGVPVRLLQLVDSAAGVYRVHHDPGVWLVILGAVVLALGSLWALVVFFRSGAGHG